jgi:hypothetical protein
MSRSEVLRSLVLATVVAGLWCVVTGRTSRWAWQVPVEYSADAWFTLSLLKAAGDGHFPPFGRIEVAELGAPFGASWNDFIRQHKPQYWLAGGLVRLVGLFRAANLLVLLAAVLAALSFHGVARYFKARPEWAFAGACAFALSPFFFYRSLTHLTLAHDWPIPLAILVVSWAFGRRGLPPGSRRFGLAALIVVVAGFHNVYFAALFVQFLGLACLAQWLVRRAARPALGALALAVLLPLTVAADNANLFMQGTSQGPAATAQRPYGNLERYALKPLELVLPVGGYGLVPWRAAGPQYARAALVKGELGSVYLGLGGVVALLALAATAARRALARPRRPVPGTALALAWTFAYSVVGGVTGLVGLTGFIWIRATQRNCAWILALVLLWGVVAASRRLAGRRALSMVVAAVALMLTLADQLPPRSSSIGEYGWHLASDAAFVQSIEARLPPGSMLFQLPVVDFPEGKPMLGATDYEHLRPYLHATQLRFSYGSDKGRPREAWQRRVETLPPVEMAAALERMGFGGLLVNRKAYADEATDLRDTLTEKGRPESWESIDHDFLLIRLRPAPQPVHPDDVVPATDETRAAPR